MEIRFNSSFSQTKPNWLLKYCIISIAKLTSASSGLHKKIRKKGEIERNDPHAIKWNKRWRLNTYHSSFLNAIKRDLIKDEVTMAHNNGYLYSFQNSNWYIVVIQESQFSLFWNGFWGEWDGQMDRLPLKLGTWFFLQ